MSRRKLRIYFSGSLAHLFELGYISTDLYQISAFSSLLEAKDIEKAERFFGEKPAPISRYTTLREKGAARTEIVDVSPGSIELAVVVSLAATIISPLVAIRVQRYLQKQEVVVQFEISPKDRKLKRVLDAYQDGTFGSSEEGLNALFTILSQRGYEVSILAENSYLIDNVVEKYSQRIVRTIKKNM